MRTVTAESLPASQVIHVEDCGRYTIQVFKQVSADGEAEIVYRLLLGGRKVPCITRADERAYPKRPAKRGSDLVSTYSHPCCSTCGEVYPKETFEGDGALWQHLGPLAGLGHYCTGEFNEAITLGDYTLKRKAEGDGQLRVPRQNQLFQSSQPA